VFAVLGLAPPMLVKSKFQFHELMGGVEIAVEVFVKVTLCPAQMLVADIVKSGISTCAETAKHTLKNASKSKYFFIIGLIVSLKIS
jgi:hypothetical protein